jgi:hypothetical protein
MSEKMPSAAQLELVKKLCDTSKLKKPLDQYNSKEISQVIDWVLSKDTTPLTKGQWGLLMYMGETAESLKGMTKYAASKKISELKFKQENPRGKKSPYGSASNNTSPQTFVVEEKSNDEIPF